MLIRPLPVISNFLLGLNQALAQFSASAALTKKQRFILGAIILGILMTESINWAAIERCSLKMFKTGQLRWFFYRAKVKWHILLQASVMNIIHHYELIEGVLKVDDTSRMRSKNTKAISKVHKVYDKKTGGYFQGQQLVFLVLTTSKVTFPIDFRFYEPDPNMSAWKKQNHQLKRKNIPKTQRPKAPKPDRERYPTIQQLAVNMIADFVKNFPDFNVKAVLADALYGDKDFMDQVSRLTHDAQVISQLRANQRCSSRNSHTNIKTYFKRQTGVKTTIKIRGDQEKEVTLLSARLWIKSHGKRRFVVALKYEGEREYRYIVASNLSWRHQDIVQTYTLRWLIEVFIQDWKCHGGWNKLAKQQGVKGATHGVIVSLLCDHFLLQHPEQSIRFKNQQPGMPVGCVVEHVKMEAFIETMRSVIEHEKPDEILNQMVAQIHEILPKRNSTKHMIGRDLGRMESTPSLVYYTRIP